jgi:hypothetical protein
LETLFDRLIDLKQRAAGYPILKKAFLKSQGYPLNLDQPTTFCEWVNFKKIKDRHPLLPITSDKLRVRDYVHSKLGKEMADEILIPLLHFGDNGNEIPFDSLPEEYFLKPNHASGLSLLVREEMDKQSLKSSCQKWLSKSYGQNLQEWAYRDIPRKILCEQVLRDHRGELPIDFKFYCIYGQVEMIGIFQKIQGKSYACYLDPSLRTVGGPMGKDIPMTQIPEIPNLEKMIQLATRLSGDFLLARIDLYSFDEKIYFGEITHYPGSGLDRFDSYELDLHLGQKIAQAISSKP